MLIHIVTNTRLSALFAPALFKSATLAGRAEFEEVRIVGVSGGLTVPSPTRVLVEFVIKQTATPFPHTIDLIDVAQIVPELASTIARNDATPELEAMLNKIEDADLLVVGTPISKASYTARHYTSSPSRRELKSSEYFQRKSAFLVDS
jgi:hypothetical protein